MIESWKSLAYTTKFSTIAFIVTFIGGFVSMGLLGALLYYPVSIVLKSFPWIDDMHGDWMWPACIMAGMLWSFGFVFGGFAWHFLYKYIPSVAALRVIYVFILWLWAAILWYYMIKNNYVPG